MAHSSKPTYTIYIYLLPTEKTLSARTSTKFIVWRVELFLTGWSKFSIAHKRQVDRKVKKLKKKVAAKTNSLAVDHP